MLVTASALAAGDWQVIRPAPSDRVLRNHDAGLAFMPGLVKVETIPPWVLESCSIVYLRLDWSQVTDAKGNPVFEKLDREFFKGYRDRGLKLAFRIMAANPHSDREYVTPQAVLDRGKIPIVRHTSVYGKAAVDPVFWDLSFIAAYNEMTRALGAYLDGKPWAGFVDIGGMGDWGEMHLERWTAKQLEETGFTPERYLQAVLAMMEAMNDALPRERKAFCYAPILMPDPRPIFDTLVAWTTSRGWWLRNDGCVPEGPQPYLRPHLDRLWQRVGFIAEPNGSIIDSGEGRFPARDWFAGQFKYHASVCNLMGHWDWDEFTPDDIAACREAARKVGYRLGVEEAVLPKTAAAPGWIAATVTLANRGVAPCYGAAGYWAVELRDGSRAVVARTIPVDPPLAELMPGATMKQPFLLSLPRGMNSGRLEVRIALVDAVHGPFDLANDPPEPGGWVRLGTVTVAPAAAAGRTVFSFPAGKVWAAAGVTIKELASGIALSGTAAESWNYGGGPGTFPVTPNTVYTMRARVRARPAGDSALYFKFGVETAAGEWAGNENAPRYDFAKPWTWQELSIMWRPQPGDARFGIAIEKGRTTPSGIDAELGEWTVEAVPVP